MVLFPKGESDSIDSYPYSSFCYDCSIMDGDDQFHTPSRPSHRPLLVNSSMFKSRIR